MSLTAGQSKTFNYTGGIQSIELPPGVYQLEVWGAQGGLGTNYSNTGQAYTGGLGGYSTGVLTLDSTTTLYICVGGKGLTGKTASGGYNGGGQTGNASYDAGTGGGATHIATRTGILSSLSSYQSSVIIVAGGGGGGGNCSLGGAGGGLSGLQPASSTQYSNRTGGTGGTQTSGYTFGTGQGRKGENLSGGGGGGWYGGGQGDNSTGGGGGSGYIGGVTSGNSLAGQRSGDGLAKITCIEDYFQIGVPRTYNYTGGIQSVTLNPGRYQLEVWGASGGKSNHGIRGGYGGYSEGILVLNAVTTIYIVVGGAGQAVNGGYNGGGNGGAANNDSAGGGGATHIALQTGVLSSLVNNKDKVIIVAGGGGASGCSSTTGGAGGGLTGETALGTSYGGAATGGTQTAGGTGGENGDGTRNNGSFGQGGHSKLTYAWPGGGGGGGWYGGGAGGNQSGGGGTAGGGSSYIGYTGLIDASTSTGVRNGDGYVVITPLTLGVNIKTVNCSTPTEYVIGGEVVTITANRSKTSGGYQQIIRSIGIDYTKTSLSKKTNNIWTFKVPENILSDLENGVINNGIITIEAVYATIKTIRCTVNTTRYNNGEEIITIEIEKIKTFNGYKQTFVGLINDYNLTLLKETSTSFIFSVPSSLKNEIITIEAIYTKTRVNSNFYRDSHHQEPFDFNKIVGDL